MSEIQSCFKRVEKKYMLTREQYKAMLLGMAFRMIPDEHPRYTIGNVYYDTTDYDLIRASLEKPVYSKQKGNHCGYGWCGGLCRWGTTNKLKALDAYAEQNGAVVYIGIAADETKRLARLKGYKRAPLAEWGVTEADALRYCRKHGIHWTENGIDLYDILDRVSCWCCCNKNQKELFNIWKYLPEYWEKLTALQEQIKRPMKRFKTNPDFGDLGNILNLGRYWESKRRKNDDTD